MHERGAWIAFALGFAAFQAGAAAWLSLGQSSPLSLLAPLVVMALHVALSFGALAMKARAAAPPLLIFCVLALAHGGINGAWIAGMARYPILAILAAQVVMIVAFTAAAVWLLRGSDALRGEDRRID